LASNSEEDGLEEVAEKIFAELRGSTRGMSPLGDLDGHFKKM
jgi:hypothetical protein